MGAHAPLPSSMSRTLDAAALRAEGERAAAISIAASAVLVPAALLVFIPYAILESGFGYRVPLQQVRRGPGPSRMSRLAFHLQRETEQRAEGGG